MHRRLCFFLISALFAMVCLGQTPSPIFTYTLHAQKEARPGWSLFGMWTPPSSVLTITPDNALLVLIPQADRKWVLKSLTGWNTGVPQEQTLPITGKPTLGEDTWVKADLTANPNGTYLIVRVSSGHVPVSALEDNPESVVTLVDLRTLSIVSRRDTTDPLIAGSYWQFNKDGLLITKRLAKRLQVKSAGVLTDTDTYEAAALTLPELKPVASCHYDDVLELRGGSTGWTTRSADTANVECAAVLEMANALSVEDLPISDQAQDRIEKLDRAAKQLKFSCPIADLSKDERFALYNCETGHPTWWDSWKMDSRASVVFSVIEEKTVATIPLPFEQPIIAALGTAGDQDYLLLLRDGIKLETYRLP